MKGNVVTISSVNLPSGASSGQAVSNAGTSHAKDAHQSEQPSAIVKISEQGRKLSQSDSSSSQPAPSQPQGIQLIAGEAKNGRISTYA
jgi:hypothetical protein